SAQEDLSHYLLTEGEERVHLKEFLDELLKLKK
ncbi:MAG: hypothetical protein ACJAZX_000540, partial [Rickettsiales bacterium]